jgi:hypothetical protein
MAEPPIKNRLESPDLTKHPKPIQDKLNACLASDPAHIKPGQNGGHVKVIQDALTTMRLRSPAIGLPEIKDKAGNYGHDTTAAVLKYKTFHGIKRSGQPLDPIVGRMTLTSLDDELMKKPPPPPTPPVTMSALAERDKTTSIRWAQAAITRLTEAKRFVVSPPPGPLPGFPPPIPPQIATTFDALEVHFHISTSAIPLADYIDKLVGSYTKALDVLNKSKTFFVDDTTSAEAAKGTPAHVPFGSGKVNFTPSFKERDAATKTGFGPNCRAAMVLHEPIHIVDHPDASFAVNHVNENDPKYASQPAANQLHNAHSYASFAQHVFFGRDTRFGIGKPDQ